MQRYDQLRFKASHNSYDRDEQPITTQLAWSPHAPHQGGCRGLELDIQECEKLWLWSVSHSGGYRGETHLQLSEHLAELRYWSMHNPGHDPIMLHIDLKEKPSDLRSFPPRFDDYVARHLGVERLFPPAMILQDSPDLVRGAQERGWPPPERMAGMIILVLTGSEEGKASYAAAGRNRLCFADWKLERGELPDERGGDRILFNLEIPSNSAWEEQARWIRKRKGFLSRAFEIDDEELWRRAMGAGINVLSTNKVRRHPWARVGDAVFTPIGGGTTSTRIVGGVGHGTSGS